MTLRRPRTAAQSTALPSLAALLASGVALDGCDTPAQTAERQRRLTEHGQQAEREFAGNQLGRSATEVGIGLGLIEAPPETRIQAPGEAPVVEVEPPMQTAGVQAPTQPTPPVPQQTPVDVDGGIRRTDPTPPPRPPTPPTPPPSHRRMQVRGGISAVHPDRGGFDPTGG